MKLEANVSSPPSPRWTRGMPLWSQRIAWWRWTLVQRPALRASAGLRAITVTWNDMGFQGLPPIPRKQDSVLVTVVSHRYAVQQIPVGPRRGDAAGNMTAANSTKKRKHLDRR